jgi:hypothetical protein
MRQSRTGVLMSWSYRGNDVNRVRPERKSTDLPRAIPWGICSPPDWRSWIALVWVIGWGWAYGIMVVQARAPQVLTWLRLVGK